ncbi:MAG: hypothetical protein IKW96_10295 [Ruminococcus sp.]|uniref:hypothetical protein n=1 Tax=Ruminococcus sp. TaxID=41978 RepID=UPI0025DF9CB3|nr:hypothetical protein [Ruminococcus sp.]MBR5683641.1 hypothetical protein [Ruminococcus sp.]
MKNYDERIESIFRKYDEKVIAERRKNAAVRRSVFSASGVFAAVLIGFLAWKNAPGFEIKQPDNIIYEPVSTPVTTSVTTENIVDTTTSSSTAGKTTQKSATTSKTTAKTTTSTANTTSTTVKVTTVETETTQTDITTEVTASPVTTTVFVPRPPDYGTEWNEVDIKPKDPNQHGSTMLKPFKLDEVVNNADLVFRGTITDRKEYEVSWTDDNGQNWGPYGNGVFEVRVDEVYYGQSDKETLKIYFPSCFRQSGDGIFGLNDSQEYIFIANAFDNDYYAHLAENPLDRTEPYKHADMYINGTRENALPIINDIVLPYYDFFKDNESVLAKDIPYEDVQELLPEEAKYSTHLRFRKEDIIGDIKELFTR